MSLLSLPRAIETFVHGFAFKRSYTHPYVPEKVDGLWVVRDAPRRRGPYRTEEWVAHAHSPAEVDAIARQHTRGRFAVSYLRATKTDPAPIRAAFKSLGYRLRTTEPLFVYDLSKIPRMKSPVPIRRVTTQQEADQLAKAHGSRLIRPQDLHAQSPIRQYVAADGAGVPIGWVSSIVVGKTTWCSTMYVVPAHRRRGIAQALLAKMLSDDRAADAAASVLLASHTGAKLYPRLGYQSIGELLLYSPPKQ